METSLFQDVRNLIISTAPNPSKWIINFLSVFADTHVAPRILICSSKCNCRAEEKKLKTTQSSKHSNSTPGNLWEAEGKKKSQIICKRQLEQGLGVNTNNVSALIKRENLNRCHSRAAAGRFNSIGFGGIPRKSQEIWGFCPEHSEKCKLQNLFSSVIITEPGWK